MIIRNKIVLVQGRPGEGKSFLTVFMASFYERIYSNINIVDKNGKQLNKYIANIDDIAGITFSKKKGVIILDEGGINLNARDSGTKNNRTYGELGMLGRKLNVDIIVCAQLGRMIDVYYRELANYIFEMHAWFDRPGYLMFEAKIYGGGGENIIKIARFDLFEWTRLTGISYNSMDSSRIDRKRKSEKKKSEILVPGMSVKDERITDMAPIWTNEASEVIMRL